MTTIVEMFWMRDLRRLLSSGIHEHMTFGDSDELVDLPIFWNYSPAGYPYIPPSAIFKLVLKSNLLKAATARATRFSSPA